MILEKNKKYGKADLKDLCDDTGIAMLRTRVGQLLILASQFGRIRYPSSPDLFVWAMLYSSDYVHMLSLESPKGANSCLLPQLCMRGHRSFRQMYAK